MDIKKSDFKHQKEEQQKLVELQAKCEEYLNGWKRAKADYENLKRETNQRINELGEFVGAEIILQLLPIYDHFKLALEHLPQDQQLADWVKGLKHIFNELTEFFKKFDIEEIKAIGQKFNPEIHEAVAQAEQEVETDQVIKEVASGYLMKGKVIKPAKVIVSKPPSTSLGVLGKAKEVSANNHQNLQNTSNNYQDEGLKEDTSSEKKE